MSLLGVSLGMLTLSFTNSLGVLYLSSVVTFFVWTGLPFIAIPKLMSAWFPRRRALAMVSRSQLET